MGGHLRCVAAKRCVKSGGSAAAVRPAALGLGLSRPLRRVLARARQCLLGRHLGGDRLSAASRRFAAQGVVPHDRHRGRRRGDRGADARAFRRTAPRFSSVWRCGAPPARSSPRCCATSRPMRRRWPATPPRSSRATQLGATGGPNGQVFMLAVYSRQRDLHRHRLRRHRSRRDRFRRRPAPAGRVVRGAVGRNHRPICRHVGAGRARIAGDAACSTRARPAGHRARPGHRRGDRRVLPTPLSFAGAADGRGRFVRRSGRLAHGGDAPGTAAGRQRPAGGGWPSCATFRRNCDRRRRHGEPTRWMADPVRLRRGLRGGGADVDRLAGRHAIAAAACRPDGQGAGRHVACARRAGAACRRSGSISVLAAALPAPRTRLAACARQCGARVRRDRRRRALLDRDRMAEWRLRHHLCRDRGHPVRAASRSGLRQRHGFHGGHGPRRRFRGDRQICGAAGAVRPSRASASRIGSLPGARRRSDGPAMADGDLYRHGRQFRAAARAREPDELRHPAILQHRAGDPRRHRRRGAFVSPAAAAIAGTADAPAAGPDLARPAPPRDGCDARERPRIGRAACTAGSAALPDEAEPLQRSQLMAALSVGSEIIRLRRIAPRLGLGSELDAALAALAQGDSAIATARLARLDHRLAARPGAEPETQLALRARANILAMSEALTQHASYFDAGAPG